MSYILRFFAYQHLPQELQEVSKPFAELAALMDETLPECEELQAGLRLLLQAKDCMVRAALPAEGAPLVPCRTQCGHCGYCTGLGGTSSDRQRVSNR